MNSSTVYVGAHKMRSKDGFMYALEVETGSLRWRYALSDASAFYPVATPTGIYFSASNGSIYALRPSDGSLLWQKQVHHQFPSPPVVSNELLYVCTDDAVSALRVTDGSQQWQRSVEDQTSIRPVIIGDRVFIRSKDGSVSALNAQEGSLLWRVPGNDMQHASLVATPDVVYLTAIGEALSALRASDGSLLWRQPMRYSSLHDPIIVQDTLYLHADRSIQARRRSDGSLLWSLRGDRNISLALAATKGLLITVEGRKTDGEVLALRTADSSFVWRWRNTINQGGVTVPVVANETVYVGVGATDGLRALSANDGSVLWHALSDMDVTRAAVGERAI